VKTLLVFGGSSFSAAHLIPYCKSVGWTRVFATQRPGSRSASPEAVDVLTCDVGDATGVRNVIREATPNAIVYLAGRTAGSEEELATSNIRGIVNVVEAAAAVAPDARILHLGSASEYGCRADQKLPVHERTPCEPTSRYGWSKHGGVKLALNMSARTKVPVIVARPFNLVGAGVPGHLFVGAMLERIAGALRNGEDTIDVGPLDTERDFLPVSDAVRAYELLLRRGATRQIYNVCSGRPLPIRTVAEMLLAMAPRPLRLNIDDRIHGNSACIRSFGSPAKLAALGFRPASTIEQALRQAWEFSQVSESACA